VRVGWTGRSLLDRIQRTPAWRLDAVIATAFVATGLLTTGRTEPGYEPRDALAVALVLATTVPHYARRLAPTPVFVVSMTAAAALYILGYDAGGLPFVIGAGAYTVAAYRGATEVLASAAYMYGAFVVMFLSDNPGFGAGEFATSVPLFAAAMVVGWTTQTRRVRAVTLELQQDEAAQRAVADERLRIAQELHDVIGHSLGVIAVQAGVGAHLIDTRPEQAKEALEHIARTSRSSLAEIRQLLGLVRSGEATANFAPTPGLADLPRLTDEVRATGMAVDLVVDEAAADLPPGVELAGYRVVQEALTNAGRHGHADHAIVRVTANDGALRIVVTDDGTGGEAVSQPGHHGLIGMRERVAVYNGSLDAGAAPGGGFRVAAVIPYDGVLVDGGPA
jgi:signal transduction histidine kinase